MKTYLDCIPCFFNQIVRTGRLLHMDNRVIMDMLCEFGTTIGKFRMDDPPPRSAVALYDMIARHAGSADPFSNIKKESTRTALTYYPVLMTRVTESEDPVSTAIKYAIAGNIIDFGVAAEFDLSGELERVLDSSSYGIWEEDALIHEIDKAEWILYLGDNTGETVFDRLLVETMARPVTYAVRSGPIINDATMEDALSAGLDRACDRIISSGCRAPGTILELCSDEFMKLFRTAPLIISKGQGNFETLSGTDAPIFYLLKAKCSVVSRHLGVKVGDLVLTGHPRGAVK